MLGTLATVLVKPGAALRLLTTFDEDIPVGAFASHLEHLYLPQYNHGIDYEVQIM